MPDGTRTNPQYLNYFNTFSLLTLLYKGTMPTSSRTGVVHFHGRSNGETLCFQSIPPSHSTHCGGSVRFRDDVGIVPYIRVEPRTTQRTLHQFFSARRPSSVTPLTGRGAKFNRPSANAGHTPNLAFACPRKAGGQGAWLSRWGSCQTDRAD